MCTALPACAVLTDLRDRDGVTAITDADFAGLPSTSGETKGTLPGEEATQQKFFVSLLVDTWILVPLIPPGVLNFKPSFPCIQ